MNFTAKPRWETRKTLTTNPGYTGSNNLQNYLPYRVLSALLGGRSNYLHPLYVSHAKRLTETTAKTQVRAE